MKLRSALALIVAAALSGCQTPDAGEYQVSRDSLFALQQIKTAERRKAPPVSVGAIEGPAKLRSRCSLPKIDGTGLPYEPGDYVRAALIEELSAAGLHAAGAAATQINGQITELSLGRGLPFNGRWTLGLRLQSSNGAELHVREMFDFDTIAFLGPTICRRAADHFEPAVRALLEQAIRSPEFPQLVAG